jgi:mycothiol system anti-sigma-R factor
VVSLADDCRQILEQVELYLDGELDPALHDQVRSHLEACGPCHDHSDFQQHLKDLLRSRCRCDEVPADLLERVRARYARPAR